MQDKASISSSGLIGELLRLNRCRTVKPLTTDVKGTTNGSLMDLGTKSVVSSATVLIRVICAEFSRSPKEWKFLLVIRFHRIRYTLLHRRRRLIDHGYLVLSTTQLCDAGFRSLEGIRLGYLFRPSPMISVPGMV